MTIEAVAQRVYLMATRDYSRCGLLVYGSYVNGEPVKDSDLDLMAIAEEPLGHENIIYRDGDLLVHMQFLGRDKLEELCVPLARNYVPEIICSSRIISDPLKIFSSIVDKFRIDRLHHQHG